MNAWNGWYHVMCNTYGTWLPGDPRGWHERKHKKHVPGDYKKPPPDGFGKGLYRYSQQMLKQGPVQLVSKYCRIVGQAMVEKLLRLQIEVLVSALDALHFHVLARFRDREVRQRIGIAKKHSYFILRDQDFQGKLWEKGADVVPIRNRQHQVHVFHYIGQHREKGAWVWNFREGVYW